MITGQSRIGQQGAPRFFPSRTFRKRIAQCKNGRKKGHTWAEVESVGRRSLRLLGFLAIARQLAATLVGALDQCAVA